MIEIFLLEQLVAFEKAGTLTGAARELHITQPALSRSKKKLEEEFGVPLFDRSNSKLALNETGKTAARYAERVLEADREMIERTLAFERSRRTIVLGACASLPVNALMPALQEAFDNMAITSEIVPDARLISGLKHHVYQLAILHALPDDPDLFCQKYMEERLFISLPASHPLARRDAVSFRDLDGLTILASGRSGFWLDICRSRLVNARLIIQDSMELLGELVESSSLPFFHSDRALEAGYLSPDRVVLPIQDEDAHGTYYLSCLSSEQDRYRSIFRIIRRRQEH